MHQLGFYTCDCCPKIRFAWHMHSRQQTCTYWTPQMHKIPISLISSKSSLHVSLCPSNSCQSIGVVQETRVPVGDWCMENDTEKMSMFLCKQKPHRPRLTQDRDWAYRPSYLIPPACHQHRAAGKLMSPKSCKAGRDTWVTGTCLHRGPFWRRGCRWCNSCSGLCLEHCLVFQITMEWE